MTQHSGHEDSIALKSWLTTSGNDVEPGLAAGFEGAAWVRLQLEDAGLCSRTDTDTDAIFGRLCVKALETRVDDRCGHLVGAGGLAVVACLYGARRRVSKKIVDHAIRRWRGVAAQSAATDATSGHAGALLACAEIETAMPGALPRHFVRDEISIVVNATHQLLRAESYPLGFAHGAAGLLVALENARQVFDVPRDAEISRLTSSLLSVLDNEAIEIVGGGAVWQRLRGQRGGLRNAWCHGGAGIALSLMAAWGVSGRRRYAALAKRALRGVHQLSDRRTCVCCGAAGRAHVLLTGQTLFPRGRWALHATDAAKQIDDSEDGFVGRGFHWGRLGWQYLLLRAGAPQMPMPGLGAFSVGTSR